MNHQKAPTIIGTGLIALDVVESKQGFLKFFAAGSCPNVFVILQTKCWNTFPIGMLGDDLASIVVLDELNQWNVNMKYLCCSSDFQTPVYVQKIHTDRHAFSNKCPVCDYQFSKFQPLLKDHQEYLDSFLHQQSDVFYLERVVDYGLKWIQHYKKNGSLIYFEPNRIDDSNLFLEIAQQAHVVKYSSERRFTIHEMTDAIDIPLEIKTHGKEGLRYRTTQKGQRTDWQTVPAFPVEHFIDACGAGDWFSANLIDQFENLTGFEDILSKIDTLPDLLYQSQQQSALNCAFEGARGLLYKDKTPLRGVLFCPVCSDENKEDEPQLNRLSFI